MAIVGEAAAKRFWPEREPIGQSLLWHSADLTAPPTRIVVVGVARDWTFGRPGTPARLKLYRPLSQHYSRVVTLLARSSNDQSNASTLRSLVSSMEPNLPLLGAQTLESQQSGPVDTQLRLAASVAGSVGLIGVLLAGIGTYGVTAYALTRRTREIAIRVSLGAPTGNVVALVSGEERPSSSSARRSGWVSRWAWAGCFGAPPWRHCRRAARVCRGDGDSDRHRFHRVLRSGPACEPNQPDGGAALRVGACRIRLWLLGSRFSPTAAIR